MSARGSPVLFRGRIRPRFQPAPIAFAADGGDEAGAFGQGFLVLGHGHGVGDAAIRAVVGAIRDIVRAEDLIFRWGGDEFFVVMVSMDTEMAELRMSKLESSLRNVLIDGMDEPMNIGVSWGFKDFTTAEGLEAAIQKADSAMYDQKQARKRMKRNQELVAATLQPRAFEL